MNYQYIDINDCFDEYIKLFPTFDTYDKANGIAGNNAMWFSANLNDELIGFYTIYINEKKIILYNFGILKHYQGKKYGDQMLKYIINQYNKYDIIVFIETNNLISLKLFISNDFIVSNNTFKPPENQVCMIKQKYQS